MRKERTLLLLGIWVMILPFLGFPQSWRTVFFVITGCALVYLAYLFYKSTRSRVEKSEDRMHVFVDNITNE